MADSDATIYDLTATAAVHRMPRSAVESRALTATSALHRMPRLRATVRAAWSPTVTYYYRTTAGAYDHTTDPSAIPSGATVMGRTVT